MEKYLTSQAFPIWGDYTLDLAQLNRFDSMGEQRGGELGTFVGKRPFG